MADVLQIVREYLGENTDDNALKLMTDIRNALDEQKPEDKSSEYKAQIEALTAERDKAIEKEKEIRKQYLDAFVNGTNTPPTPTHSEEIYPGKGLSLNDWLYENNK